MVSRSLLALLAIALFALATNAAPIDKKDDDSDFEIIEIPDDKEQGDLDVDVIEVPDDKEQAGGDVEVGVAKMDEEKNVKRPDAFEKIKGWAKGVGQKAGKLFGKQKE